MTSYNNFYEFGTDKPDPAARAGMLRPRPWTVSVEGEVKKSKVFDPGELLKLATMEERIYRLRCVEGWSMVIPWGYSLAELIKCVEPTGNAKYVEFITLADKAQMPGLRSPVLDWPPARAKLLLLHPAAKPVAFGLCLLPFAGLLYDAFADTLGANPAEALIRSTGDWTLRFLCITLTVTPLRQWTGQHALARYRRMLGLFAFFYSVSHFLSYAWLDMGFDLQAIVRDIPKRPFALAGFLALLLMVPLAATSFNRAIKALGAVRWQVLHRLVNATVLLGLLHFFWMRAAKNNFAEVAVYAVVIAVLLGWRLRERVRSMHRIAARVR